MPGLINKAVEDGDRDLLSRLIALFLKHDKKDYYSLAVNGLMNVNCKYFYVLNNYIQINYMLLIMYFNLELNKLLVNVETKWNLCIFNAYSLKIHQDFICLLTIIADGNKNKHPMY